MKRQYEKPSMNIEMFEANEYIASCTVQFKCNAKGQLWKETNKIDGLQTGWGGDIYLGDVSPCDATHTAPVDAVSNGYLKQKGNKTINVYLWQESKPYNHHATTDWNLSPNAS